MNELFNFYRRITNRYSKFSQDITNVKVVSPNSFSSEVRKSIKEKRKVGFIVPYDNDDDIKMIQDAITEKFQSNDLHEYDFNFECREN